MTPRTYYAIPTNYTIGDEFETLAEAFAEAATRLQAIAVDNAENHRFVPLVVTVDERVSDEQGDRIVHRYLTGRQAKPGVLSGELTPGRVIRT